MQCRALARSNVSTASCTIVHVLRGRVRLSVPSTKAQPALAQRLTTFWKSQPGIVECRANIGCGSLTLHYNPHCWTGDELCKQICLLSRHNFTNLPAAGEVAPPQTSWFELSLSSAGMVLGLFCEPLAPVLLPLLLTWSALPMLRRAYEAFVRDGRLTVDVLDASATALLSTQGQF